LNGNLERLAEHFEHVSGEFEALDGEWKSYIRTSEI
jgi:hypothetical protein